MRKLGIEGTVPGFLLGAALLAAQTKPAEPTDSGLVLRFDVDLVQMDAVVTGRDGRRVPGLKADDFEVLQDGKPQAITHFSYVAGADRLKPVPQELEREQVQRTMVIVVDDIFMHFGDFVFVRQALTRFIDEEIRTGDLVSLVYTSHGSGALRQFTSDKRLLHRAVERMYWRPPTGVETAFPGMSFLREMTQVITELGSFPGRKAVVLVAPGSRAEMPDVRGIADKANRSSVTIYSVDARGLPAMPPGGEWDASVSGGFSRRPPSAPSAWSEYYQSQDTMSLLASATGGLFLHDSNATFDQLREAAEDAAGYYLIGWYPGADAFRQDPKRMLPYHRVQIRMRDKSLRARTREGYYARPGTPGPRLVFSTREQMRDALVSPFRSGDLEVSLTAWFQRQEAAGSYVDSLMHIAAKGVRFEADAGGCWNARLELARALWPVDPGIPQNDRVNEQILDVHTCGKTAERVREEGFIAMVEDRLPTPGAYQVRVAVRNAGSDGEFSFGPKTLERREGMQPAQALIGSATQFLVIPDLKRRALAVSGITLWAGNAPAAPSGDVTYRPPNDGDPATRHFRAGAEMHYSFRVFGAAAEVRLRVLREGQEVAAVAGAAETGVLPLAGMTPGRYVLGVVASHAAGKGKPQRAEQWVDFEIM